MKLIFKIALIFFLVCKIADAQQVKLVVKLKASAPDGLVQSLKSNFKSQQYRLTKILSKFNTSVPKKLFPENSLKKFSARDITSNGFDRIFIINAEPEKYSSLLSLINTDKDVEYAEKVSEYRLNNFPINDPYFPNQYYLSKINSPQSLEITQGDSTVIIGVIDSGLDFTHPDLLQSFKINYAETQNGIDDDGNGYIDDIRGWNFVDDNNNPQDNNLYSHGTSVTGIINASINNGIGIASVAPKCKVLVLKAFDANGIGGEDDVARAILYGMGRG
ncbi:MAG TPA: S8 family serine peptidase, partial [Ignavibacteria bacterium]|nr:S8 family serine peptidase [Ignavibacteria bacterium]